MLELTGFLGLTRIPLGFWAHTDLTDPTVLLCGWEISQMILRVGCAHADSALLLGSHGSHFLGSHGSHRSHSIALWVGNLTDASVCGRVTKLQKIVLFGGRFERFEKKVWKKLLH